MKQAGVKGFKYASAHRIYANAMYANKNTWRNGNRIDGVSQTFLQLYGSSFPWSLINPYRVSRLRK